MEIIASFFHRGCSIKVTDFRDGQRHDMWLALKNIKMGRLHLAITVIEGDKKVSLILSLDFIVDFAPKLEQ